MGLNRFTSHILTKGWVLQALLGNLLCVLYEFNENRCYFKIKMISYSLRRMIIMTTGDAVKNRFPHLNVTWEILDYDSPARIEAKTLTGKFESFVIEGFDKSKRAEILDNWKFNASLDPFHEVLAPKIPESAG